MPSKKTYLRIGLGLLILVIVIFLVIYCNSTSSTSNNNFKATYTDDSDSPQPPTTLEYNRTLAPPKRNNNIVNACAAGLPKKCYDKINGFYFKLPGEILL